MPDSQARIIRLTGKLSLIIALMVTCIGPSIYFGLAYQYQSAALETEALINAQIITQFVSENPRYWSYMEDRLLYLLKLKAGPGEDFRRRLLDHAGEEIVSNNIPALSPVLVRSEPFFDAGHLAGYIELTRTLRTVLIRTAYTFLLSGMMGLLIFMFIRLAPLQALRDALADLEQSRLLLQSVFKTFNDAVLIMRADTGQILDSNPAAEKLFAMSRRDMVRSGPAFRARHLGFPEDAPTASQAVIEAEMRRGDGRTFPAEYSRASFTDRAGHRIEVIAIRDITERKNYENHILLLNKELESRVEARTQDLADREQRLRYLFTKSPSPVLILDVPSGTILDANESALLLLECDEPGCIGGNFSTFASERTYAEFVALLRPPEQGISQEHMAEAELITRTGEARFATLHVRHMEVQGQMIALCSVFDITETVRLRDQWRLSLEKLVQAEKMEFLGTMVSGFARDINNPNQLIRTNVQLVSAIWMEVIEQMDRYAALNADHVLGGLPYERAKESVSLALLDMEAGSNRIARIIRNLMGFARERHVELSDSVSINRVVEDAVMLLRHRIRQKTDHFSATYDNNSPLVRGNAQSLEQAVINLIMNAIEALPDTSHRVSVETRYNPEEKKILIRVEDNGTGMSRDVIERSRHPFFTTKEKSGGSGLGLAITQMLVNEHNGTLKIDSVPGAGTTAVISLPLS